MDAGEPAARTHIFADVVGVGRHRMFLYLEQLFLYMSTLGFTDNPVMCQKSSCSPLP